MCISLDSFVSSSSGFFHGAFATELSLKTPFISMFAAEMRCVRISFIAWDSILLHTHLKDSQKNTIRKSFTMLSYLGCHCFLTFSGSCFSHRLLQYGVITTHLKPMNIHERYSHVLSLLHDKQHPRDPIPL